MQYFWRLAVISAAGQRMGPYEWDTTEGNHQLRTFSYCEWLNEPHKHHHSNTECYFTGEGWNKLNSLDYECDYDGNPYDTTRMDNFFTRCEALGLMWEITIVRDVGLPGPIVFWDENQVMCDLSPDVDNYPYNRLRRLGRGDEIYVAWGI